MESKSITQESILRKSSIFRDISIHFSKTSPLLLFISKSVYFFPLLFCERGERERKKENFRVLFPKDATKKGFKKKIKSKMRVQSALFLTVCIVINILLKNPVLAAEQKVFDDLTFYDETMWTTVRR